MIPYSKFAPLRVTGSALSHAQSVPCRSEENRAMSKGSRDEGTEKETGARRTPASKRTASSTRRITKEYLDQLKSRLGDNTGRTRPARATCVERRDEFAGGIRRAQISWRDVTADSTTVDGAMDSTADWLRVSGRQLKRRKKQYCVLDDPVRSIPFELGEYQDET